MGYMICNLPEDTVDVMVKVRILWGTHTLEERPGVQLLEV